MTDDDVADVADPPGSFGQGIAIGVAATSVLVHILLVGLTGNWEKIFREFGDARLPLVTKIAISLPWQLGVPVLGVVAIGALVVRRPRSLVPYVAVAIVFALVAVATYWLPMLPFRQLVEIKGPE